MGSINHGHVAVMQHKRAILDLFLDTKMRASEVIALVFEEEGGYDVSIILREDAKTFSFTDEVEEGCSFIRKQALRKDGDSFLRVVAFCDGGWFSGRILTTGISRGGAA